MNGKSLTCLVVLMQTSFATPLFYHEPSLVVFKSDKENTDFGFSMGYRINERQLVVGSPHADPVGKVYSCSIDRDPKNKTCSDLNIDVKRLADDYDKTDNDQHFCLGATIAVTSKYFVTCAPLWTTTGIKNIHGGHTSRYSGSYGTCFVYSGNIAQRFNGILEQGKKKDDGLNYVYMYGGIGWSSLADEENEVLLVAKPFDSGDIQYVNSKDLETDAKSEFKSLFSSQFKDTFKNLLQRKTNIGYAMAAGRFFSDYYMNTTSYAFSMKDQNDVWQIQFLYKEKNGMMNIVKKSDADTVKISFETNPGDMFGAAMASADLDADGVTDLLVGAPTHTLPGQSETGALYIFKGGEMSSFRNRMHKIVSDEKRSRFGSAIATTDLDGDFLPEIFVSAPYEDSGDGALYIISGYQLKKSSGNYKTDLVLKDIAKLSGVQRIKNRAFQSFGFRISILRDINDNGCDDLVVAAPRTSSVILFRCLPSVKATIEAKRPNEVKTSDSKFIVHVCVNITYRTNKKIIPSGLQVVSKVIGKGATLSKDKFNVDLSLDPSAFCDDVVVNLRVGETGSYSFTANLNYLDETVYNNKAFDNKWVRLSVDSELVANTVIQRACSEDNCTPDLHMDILWDGSKEPKELYVNEKTKKNVTLVIRNDGAIAYDACILVRITGGKERIRCEPLSNQGEYKCPIPVTMGKHNTHNLNFVVGIEKARNMGDTVQITADLFNDCAASVSEQKKIKVKYIFGMRNVFILESSHNVTVTDTQIQNRTNPTLIDTHEYKIVNNGSLEWEDVSAIINVPSRPYFESTHILINEVETGCVQRNTSAKNSSDIMSFICYGMKLYDVPILINIRNEIAFAKIMQHLVDGKLKIESHIEVRMASSNDTLQFPNKTQTTIINYVQETSIGNNKNAIMIIVIFTAIVILLIVAFFLYKIGFFQRKEKNRLDSFKASIKRKNREGDKPSTSGGDELKPDSKEDSMEDFEIEVIDDCEFEPIPMTTDDGAALIAEDNNEPTTSQNHKTNNQDTSTCHRRPLVVEEEKTPEKGKDKDRQSTKM